MGDSLEIERKYICGSKRELIKVKMALGKLSGYNIDASGKGMLQVDSYYDTKEMQLYKSNKSLRYRDIDNECKMTIKAPLSTGVDSKEVIRVEEEVRVKSKDLVKNKEYIKMWLPEISVEGLHESLVVMNLREVVLISKGDLLIELVLDDLTYHHNGEVAVDYQVELELKSGKEHIGQLGEVAEEIEKYSNCLKSSKESKYIRGLRLVRG